MCEILRLALAPTAWTVEPHGKRWKEILTLAPSTIGRYIPFRTLRFTVCTSQLLKTAPKHDRFFEDLGDNMILTPGFGFNLRSSYCPSGHMQSPLSGLASLLTEQELAKHAKVVWGGLTKPLLGSRTGIQIAIFSRFVMVPRLFLHILLKNCKVTLKIL